jgi:HAE1 family hydrophobic/amphiphilic exporter-1
MLEPSVQRIDITGDALITWVVRSPTMTPEEISWFIDNEVSRDLLAISGVGEVNRSGGVDREIRVELDPDRLASFGLTAASVSGIEPGVRVVVQGAGFLNEGDKVTIAAAPTAAPTVAPAAK